MSDEELRIYPIDVRNAGYCMRGCRDWFARRPELDYRDFLRNGIPASQLPMDNGVVEHVLRVKRKNG